MAKHEYEVLITYTEVHSVFVEAEDEEAAEELALDAYSEGTTEMSYSRTEAKVNWSDEEG
jgi:hypothetical protein